ncbi:hypothetical protein Tco_0534381 [Tanacetum coccineum]
MIMRMRWINIEGVEELKRIVKIKGVQKEALHTLRQKLGQYICYQKHLDVVCIHSDDGNPSSANIKQALRCCDNENKQVTVKLMQYVLKDPILQVGNPVKEVMDAPTILVSVDSSKGNFRDAVDVGVDVFHPVPVAAVAFPAEMSTLRFMMGMAEAENASLCGKIKTMEAIEMATHSQVRKACMEMERQLASV